MKPSRSTILVLILVGVLTAFQALLGEIVATRLETWLGPWADYVLPTFLVITGILIGYTVRDQLSRSEDTKQRQAARNRRVMLEQVWRTWIDGVLNPSLYKATLVPLSL